MEDKRDHLKSLPFLAVAFSFLLFFFMGSIFSLSIPFLFLLYLSFLFFSYLFGVFELTIPPLYGINFKTEIIFFLTVLSSFLLAKFFPDERVPFLFWLIFLFYLNLLEPFLDLLFSRKGKVPVVFVAKRSSNPFPKILTWCGLEPAKALTKEELSSFLPNVSDKLGRLREFQAIVLEENAPEIKRIARNYLSNFFLLKSSWLPSYFTGSFIKRMEDFPFLAIRIKRMIDFILSLLILLFVSPFFLFLSLCIKLDSPGPVFYRHKRIGRNGRSFYLLKFRTMVADADKKLAEILARNPSLQEEFLRTYKLKNDPRITAFGKVLRSLSIDELPQLINVIRGEMSLVGPRPIVEEEIKYYEAADRLIFKFFPGVTGLWQTSGRTDLSYEQRVSLDQKYCHNWNLLTDLKLILRTIPAVLSQRGAY
jgi:exopolysaccharide production protein ExoY